MSSALSEVQRYILASSDNPFQRANPVHRLDKDTSGVLLFAKTPLAHRFYARQFKKREVEKTYVAVVAGDFRKYLADPKFGDVESADSLRIQNYLSKKPLNRRYHSVTETEGDRAETFVQFIDYNSENDCSLLRLSPGTGRTHQLRVHLAETGFPILGDRIYEGREFPRLMLHAWRLCLQYDAASSGISSSGKKKKFSKAISKCFMAPIPKEFAELVGSTFPELL
jgi:23S rRNA-/tRNA-specific pseudouridylate synthase